MIIRAVSGRFAVACHYSHVWNLSSERQHLKANYENGEIGIRILGEDILTFVVLILLVSCDMP